MKKSDMNRAFLLGLGFDNTDGEKRITLSKDYKIYGGSKETHETMKEKCSKFNEHLKKKGKALHDISVEEFYDVASKAGLKIPNSKRF